MKVYEESSQVVFLFWAKPKWLHYRISQRWYAGEEDQKG